MKNIAIILSGCGHFDGAEIRESVLTLLYLDKQGANVQCFAPDINQMHVVNHITGAEEKQSRNVLVESARIARGDIKDIKKLDVTEFDALIIPGGFGVAKNLSDLAVSGSEAIVNDDFKITVNEFIRQQKPIGAICISPAVLAAAISGQHSASLTIGEDESTASIIESFGSKHKNCPTDDYIYDEKLKIVSCSAYMREDNISYIAKGIEKLVNKIINIS